MGIEGLQHLPSGKPPNAVGVLMSTVGVLFLIIIVACWTATQYAAAKLAYQPALGVPLLSLGRVGIYSPFDFFVWLIKFGHVEGTEDVWQAGEWILFSLHFLFVPAIWMAVRRYRKASEKTDLHGSAHWATEREIEKTGLLGSSTGGCYVGGWFDPKSKRTRYLTHNGPEHILALAPTRSGKGVGLVLPTLLSWKHSAVVHDIKGEAWALTAGYRHSIGQRVLKFEPSNPDGSSVCYNPLEEVRLRSPREVADAQNIAQMIVDPDGRGLEDHWAKTGHELLSAAILHILYCFPNKTLRGLVSFFCDPGRDIDQVAEEMLNAQHNPAGSQGWLDPITGKPATTHPMIAEAARSFLNKSENERSGVQSTAMSFLTLYRDPIVAMNTAVSEFRIRDLMHDDKAVSLYIVVAPNDKARLRPLIRLLINQVLRLSTEKMDFADGRSVAGYKHRLLMMIDEFPSLGRLEQMEEALAFVAGYGIKCYLITQDLSQLQKAYSRDESIIPNCHIRIAYAPNKYETAKWLSDSCGTMTVRKTQQNVSGNRLSPFLMHVMVSEQETQRPLITPDEAMRLPGPVKSADGASIVEPGDMLIQSAGFAPIYGQQILYFKDPVFSARAKIPAPTMSDRIIERRDKAVSRLDRCPAPPIAVPAVEPAVAAAATEAPTELVGTDEMAEHKAVPDSEYASEHEAEFTAEQQAVDAAIAAGEGDESAVMDDLRKLVEF